MLLNGTGEISATVVSEGGKLTVSAGNATDVNLRWLADTCADYGYTMAMENHPRSAPTAKDLLEYIDMLDRPAIKPMVDTTEVKEADGEPAEFLRQLTPCHLHMSDFGNGQKHIPIGTGEVDWKAIVKTLKDKGYTGYYNLEPSYKYYIDDVENQLRKDYEYITALI